MLITGEWFINQVDTVLLMQNCNSLFRFILFFFCLTGLDIDHLNLTEKKTPGATPLRLRVHWSCGNLIERVWTRGHSRHFTPLENLIWCGPKGFCVGVCTRIGWTLLEPWNVGIFMQFLKKKNGCTLRRHWTKAVFNQVAIPEAE